MNNGKIAGMLNSDADIQFPGLYYNTLRLDEKYPEGESPIEFYERIKINFETILRGNKYYDDIMLVTHGGVINIIYYIYNSTISWSNKQSVFQASNTSIHRLKIDGNNVCFDIENLNKHLTLKI